MTPAKTPKFRLYFPDGDWFRDEDGYTEFSARRADAIEEALAGHVELERRPWPPADPEG
jgi:hypothetical protein